MTEFHEFRRIAPTARRRAPAKESAFVSVASARRALFGLCDGISEIYRLVRAYNELTRLDNRTLGEIGRRRGELDRILRGLPPHR